MYYTRLLTRKDFKATWEKNDSEILSEEFIPHYLYWGLRPRNPPDLSFEQIRYLVLKEAGVDEAEDFHPDNIKSYRAEGAPDENH